MAAKNPTVDTKAEEGNSLKPSCVIYITVVVLAVVAGCQTNKEADITPRGSVQEAQSNPRSLNSTERRVVPSEADANAEKAVSSPEKAADRLDGTPETEVASAIYLREAAASAKAADRSVAEAREQLKAIKHSVKEASGAASEAVKSLIEGDCISCQKVASQAEQAAGDAKSRLSHVSKYAQEASSHHSKAVDAQKTLEGLATGVAESDAKAVKTHANSAKVAAKEAQDVKKSATQLVSKAEAAADTAAQAASAAKSLKHAETSSEAADTAAQSAGKYADKTDQAASLAERAVERARQALIKGNVEAARKASGEAGEAARGAKASASNAGRCSATAASQAGSVAQDVKKVRQAVSGERYGKKVMKLSGAFLPKANTAAKAAAQAAKKADAAAERADKAAGQARLAAESAATLAKAQSLPAEVQKASTKTGKQEETAKAGLAKARSAMQETLAAVRKGNISAARKSGGLAKDAAKSTNTAAGIADRTANEAQDASSRLMRASRLAERLTKANVLDQAKSQALSKKAQSAAKKVDGAVKAAERSQTRATKAEELSERAKEAVESLESLQAATDAVTRAAELSKKTEDELEKARAAVKQAEKVTKANGRRKAKAKNTKALHTAAQKARAAAIRARKLAEQAGDISQSADQWDKAAANLPEGLLGEGGPRTLRGRTAAIRRSASMAKAYADAAAKQAEWAEALAEGKQANKRAADKKGETKSENREGQKSDLADAEIPELPKAPDSISLPEGAVTPSDKGNEEKEIAVVGRWRQVSGDTSPDFLPGGYSSSILAFRVDGMLEVTRTFGKQQLLKLTWCVGYTVDKEKRTISLGRDPNARPSGDSLKGFSLPSAGVRATDAQSKLPLNIRCKRLSQDRMQIGPKLYVPAKKP